MKKVSLIGCISVSLSMMAGVERGFSAAGMVDGTTNPEQSGQVVQERNPLGKQKSPQQSPTIPPPVHDPEMVIKPDVPPDPDAVVIPPTLDSEMAVDPATREPVTPEELKERQKDILGEKDKPENQQRETPQR
jgi:hypothetical protein